MHIISISDNVLVLLISMSLALGFMNGFHDSVNSITTIVSSRVLKPKHAILFSTFFNVAAALVFQFKPKVGQDIVNQAFIDHYVLFGALMGALSWNIIAWIYDVSSSSSQALVGSMLGATMAKVGLSAVISTGVLKILFFIVAAPTIGFSLASLIMLLIRKNLKATSPAKVEYLFQRIQLFSVACYSLAHGINDAQKSIGIICLLLISMGSMDLTDTAPPLWVTYTCFTSIGLGTLFGGWRVVKNMRQRLVRMNPVNGCSAEIALTLLFICGIPLSARHTIKGSVLASSGSNYRRLLINKWLKDTIVWSWIVTMPVTAGISAISWYIGKYYLPTI
jgi:inorganic phosphate transporter, PiT family